MQPSKSTGFIILNKDGKRRRIRKCRRPRRLDREEWNPNDKLIRPDWSSKCEVCGAKPVVPLTGLCGPCTFGEAETADGNW